MCYEDFVPETIRSASCGNPSNGVIGSVVKRYWLLILGAAVLSAACTWGASANPTSNTCAAYEWTAPETLRGPGGAALYVESPQMILRGETLWLIGSPTWAVTKPASPMLWPGGDSVTPDLIGASFRVTKGGRALGWQSVVHVPPGLSTPSAPRAALSDDGVLHILFRESSSPSRSTRAAARTVWSAGWKLGYWSPPTVLLDSTRNVGWANSLVSRVTNAGKTPFVLAPMGTRDSLVVLRLTERGWTAGSVPFPSHIYSDIAGTDRESRTLPMTYVIRNDIYAAEFNIVANRVTQAVRVASFPVGATIKTRMLAIQDARRIVVWLESSPMHQGWWFLRVTESRDGGSSWTSGSPIRVRAGSGILDATSDGMGRVHVLFDNADASPSAPAHAFWNGKVWRQTQLPSLNGHVVPSPSIRTWGQESVLAIWAMAASSTSMPVTVWSLGSPCSAPHSRIQ